MNVLVNTSARFSRTPDGRYWAPSENLAYSYWKRFLDGFEEVTVLGRVVSASALLPGAKSATGPGVSVIPLPNYCGIREFVGQYFAIRKIVRQSLAETDAIYLSLPCLIGDLVWRLLPRDRPFGVGVCGDPYDAFAPGSSTHMLRPLMRQWFSHRLRVMCKRACACTYVTERALQLRYPCSPKAFSTYYSSIHLESDVIATAPREQRSGQLHVMNVGTFDTWYKGPDILLNAFSSCCKLGLDLKLTFIGDGRYRSEIEKMADKLGVAARVRFLGQLPFSAAVRAELDTADLFVFPSRQEGLPKALVEAMARGLPCIGTAVGGIPELLSTEDLVAPNDAEGLGQRMREVLADPERRAAMSSRNLATAKKYESEILRRRRIAFYQALRGQTDAWIQRKLTPTLLTTDRV